MNRKRSSNDLQAQLAGVAVAFSLGLVSPVFAHDMWLVPPATAAVGKPVEVAVAVGMDFPTSLNVIDPARLTVAALGPDGEAAPVTLRADEDRKVLVASFTPKRAGLWLVTATTRPNRLALEAAKFNDYLLHDGLPHVLAGRMDRGELDRDATEQYSKYCKTIVPVGDVGGAATTTRFGTKLEIVPAAGATSTALGAKVGGSVAVRVLFEGVPLKRGNLCWDHPGNGEDFTGQTWTDENGTALVPIGKAGLMTLRLVHMTRPLADDYEWESFWSSFTFRVPATGGSEKGSDAEAGDAKGGDDNFVQAFDEARMDAAIAEARSKLATFIDALKAERLGDMNFSLKKGFAYGDQERREFIWISAVRMDGDDFVGKIGNKPVHDIGFKMGDEVRITRDEVSDWMFMRKKRLRGGFTIAALTWGSERQAQFERQMGIDWSAYDFLRESVREAEHKAERKD